MNSEKGQSSQGLLIVLVSAANSGNALSLIESAVVKIRR